MKTYKLKTDDFSLIKKMATAGTMTKLRLGFSILQWRFLYVATIKG